MNKYVKKFPQFKKTSVSAADAWPDIVKWWDYEKNGDADPHEISTGAHEKYYLKCPECGNETFSAMYYYFSKKNPDGTFQPPVCKKCHPSSSKLKVNLVDAVPDIEKYWDYEANEGKNPSDFGASSSVKVWTKCPVCGTSVLRNVRFTWAKDEQGVGHVINCRTCGKRKKENSLVELFPDIKKYWIDEKNDHGPEYYTISSGKRIYIRCPDCGAERNGVIGDLVVKDGTGYRLTACSNCKAIGPKHTIKKGQTSIAEACPDVLEYWSDTNEYSPEEVSITSAAVKVRLYCPECDMLTERYAVNSFVKNEETGLYEVRKCQSCAVAEANRREALKRNVPLVEECPEFGEWWDFYKNTADIRTVTRGSRIPVHLRCPACRTEIIRTPHDFVNFNRAGELHTVACPECGYNCKGNPEDNLLKLCPSIKDWWDYASNYPLVPEQFTQGSQFKAYCTCPECGLSLYAPINSLVKFNEDGKLVVRHEGKCRKIKAVKSEKNLAKRYPQVKEWWDYEKNGSAVPEEYTIGSPKKMYFKCHDCGGERQMRIVDAFMTLSDGTPRIFKCPYCEGIKPLKGLNTLADVNPELAKEWSPNNEKPADQVLPALYKRALWICPDCGREYSALIKDREVGDHACPYCNEHDCITGYNDLETLDPELAKEWSPNNSRPASKIWRDGKISGLWICPDCGGEYWHYVSDREAGDNACPYCRNRKALAGLNSLADIKPELVPEWSPNNDVAPDEVTATASRTALWICPDCGGEYSYSVRDRKVGDCVCPYCNDRKVLSGFNSLKARHPELIEKEWCYIENTLLRVNPDKISESYSGKVWWKCPDCGRKYILTVKERLMKEKRGHVACLQCRGLRWKRCFTIPF